MSWTYVLQPRSLNTFDMTITASFKMKNIIAFRFPALQFKCRWITIYCMFHEHAPQDGISRTPHFNTSYTNTTPRKHILLSQQYLLKHCNKWYSYIPRAISTCLSPEVWMNFRWQRYFMQLLLVLWEKGADYKPYAWYANMLHCTKKADNKWSRANVMWVHIKCHMK